MPEPRPITILCLAGHFKGNAFMEECKRQGCNVLLLTKEKLNDEPWARASIDEVFLMPDPSKRPDNLYAVSYLARTRQIDRIIPLDDYDVETVANLREHLRIPGMGDTTARHFRDKLAMRVEARDHGLLVPDFTHVLNYDRLREFMGRVSPPWVLKPRSEAGAMGIKRISSEEELWRWLDTLGDQQSFFVLERYVPGDVFHVDSIVPEREVVFSIASQYGRPPLNVSHEGGIFVTRTLSRESPESQALIALNKEVMTALRMVRGVTHAEYIRGHADGRWYFLETAARVGGANIAETIEFATGLNLWAEWARIELAHVRGEAYQVPPHRSDYAGIVVCLARQEHPDTSAYNDPELVWRMDKKNHVGLIVASPDPSRVQSLLDSYSQRVAQDFLAVLPPLDKPED
ncbi:MAG: ATP-grasp domain-containing protein [Anaerolineales bacterium]